MTARGGIEGADSHRGRRSVEAADVVGGDSRWEEELWKVTGEVLLNPTATATAKTRADVASQVSALLCFDFATDLCSMLLFFAGTDFL